MIGTQCSKNSAFMAQQQQQLHQSWQQLHQSCPLHEIAASCSETSARRWLCALDRMHRYHPGIERPCKHRLCIPGSFDLSTRTVPGVRRVRGYRMSLSRSADSASSDQCCEPLRNPGCCIPSVWTLCWQCVSTVLCSPRSRICMKICDAANRCVGTFCRNTARRGNPSTV